MCERAMLNQKVSVLRYEPGSSSLAHCNVHLPCTAGPMNVAPRQRLEYCGRPGC